LIGLNPFFFIKGSSDRKIKIGDVQLTFFLLILAVEKMKEAKKEGCEKKGGGAEYIIDCFVFDDYQQHQFLPERLDHLYIQTPSPPCN